MNIGARTAMWSGGAKKIEYGGVCFAAASSGTEVSITYNFPSFVPDCHYVYSRDGVIWNNYVLKTPIVLANVGDKVFFAAADGGNTRAGGYANENFNARFKIEKGAAYCTGDIKSLIDRDLEKDIKYTSYAFFYIFMNTSNLLSIPNITIDQKNHNTWILGGMFSGASGFVDASSVDLPLSNNVSVYSRLFNNCKSITKGPKIRGGDTRLGSSFSICYQMFYGCSSLNEIWLCDITSWSNLADSSFTEWVSGVSPTGVFHCKAELGTNETIERGESRCPEGWVVVNDV